MDTYNDVWEAVLEYCKTKASSTGYKLWIANAEIKDFKNNTFILCLSSPLKKKIVMEQYGTLLKEAFENVMGFDINISYECAQESPAIFEDIKSEPEEKKDNVSDELFTFDTFIEGPSNRFAYRAAIAVAENPGGSVKSENVFNNYNPLFIYGKSGLGKTHILNAICYEIHKNYPSMRILYTRAEDFANEFINSLGKKTVDDFHDKFRNIDVLLIDDIQFIGGKVQDRKSVV